MNCVKLGEPPGADPHAGWCERAEPRRLSLLACFQRVETPMRPLMAKRTLPCRPGPC